jgi:hypothetical protein
VAYDEDITEKPQSTSGPVSEYGCFILTIMVTLLMLVIAIPTFYTYISDPIPTILALGMTGLILSILYLASVINKISSQK